MSINWYMTLYYRYRDYPITHINIKYKRNQLKSIYANIFSRLSLYFYIDIQPQHPQKCPESKISSIKSNLKNAQKLYSGNCASIHSRLFNSRKKMSNKKLKSQVVCKDYYMYPQSQLTDKQLASMNIFKMQDRPIDEQLQMKANNISNLLKLIINTSKQIISTILIQSKKNEKDSTYEIYSEDSSAQISHIQKSQGQFTIKKQNKQIREQICIEVIPNANEQINFYFLEFCSKIDVPDKLNINKVKEQQQSKVSLKDILKQKNKLAKNQMDSIILQIQKQQLQYSHFYLSRFQVLTSNNSSQNLQKDTGGQLNIMVQTWLQIIGLIQKQQVLYQIILELVTGAQNPFVEKITSYLHLITLINTKTLFASSISKSNFLWFLPELLSGNRTLNDFKLQKTQNLVQIYDVLLDRYIYGSEAYTQVLDKWRHIGIIISQLLIKKADIFWAKVFESCCQLFDQYLEQKVQFSYSMIILYERLQKQNQNSIKLPEQKRQYYQKSIKVILQRQVGFSDLQSSFNTKTQIKSKISMGFSTSAINSNAKSNNFYSMEPDYVFYNQKMAGSQSKITQLRQWQMVLRQSIDSLKGYRKILDTGLKIFKGVPQCITIFFLESYFNLKKAQVITNFQFLQIINRYCHKLTNSVSFQNLFANISGQSHACLQQLQIHMQNYKYITKKMMSNFRSKQMGNNKINLGVRNQYQNQKIQQQSVYSQYQTNPENNQSQELLILQQEFISGIITKLRSQKNKDIDRVMEQKTQVIDKVNTHIKLINQCNFIFTIIQQNQLANNSQKLPGKIRLYSKSKNLVILNSKQLVVSLNRLNIEQEKHNKMMMMQTQNFRKTSSQNNKTLRMSSVNVPFKKNSLVGNGPQSNSTTSFIDEQKIIQRIQQHNSCLYLIIQAYYNYTKFYKIFHCNILCQNCCYNSEQLQQNRQIKLNLNTQNNKCDQNQWHTITANKIVYFTKKYQQLSKSKNIHDGILDLEKQLKMQISLNNINNQILSIFMFIASLEVDSLTFLAIFKQQLISEDKLGKVKVIGKAYYDRIHQLLTKNIKCGKILQHQSFQQRKNMYLQNLLVVIVSLIDFLYQRTEEYVQLVAFTQLIMNYFISKTYNVSNNDLLKESQQLINLSKIISQSFDWNEQNMPQLSQKELIVRLLDLRTKLSNQSLVLRLKQLINSQFNILNQYQNSSEKVQYLQRKLLYLILREIYFDTYYDIGIFQVKSTQARKNFAMYQTKMLNFFQQIIAKDERQFLQRKSQQLKQRSAHLKGYLLQYQKEPNYHTQQRNLMMKTVCIFDKTLNILTQNREYEMKKRGSNSISLLRKNRRKIQPIYMHYVSTQFTKPNQQKVKVFQNQSYYFFKAIQIYQDMLCKKVEDSQKKYSIYKQLGFSVPTSVCVSFHERDLQLIQESRQSLLALWINCSYKGLHQTKMTLSHQNFLSKIEKLYIDLDVRHKVFESFKGKILNYQMQKTKIYHQYMDYIRGLKLDVYSHVTGQDPIPYFKLIHAIKLYRLDVKKKELEEKVNEQFGKNLGKWNQGIVKDMKQYHEWVCKQVNFWTKMNEGSNKAIKQLFEIYAIVNKQLKKHENKNIQLCHRIKQNQYKASKSSNSSKKSLFKRKSLLQIK